MSKEIEETIINDENQMKELYDKIDKLNIIIKEKDDIIKTYEDTFIGLNSKINLLYKENEDLKKHKTIVPEHELDDHASININKGDKDNKILLKEINDVKLLNKKLLQDKKELQEEYKRIQEETKINIEETLKYRELKDKNDELIYELNNKNTDTTEIVELTKKLKDMEYRLSNTPNEKDIENKYKKIYEEKVKREKKPYVTNPQNEDSLHRKYPITVYKDIGESVVKKMVASKCAYLVKYQYEIADRTNRLENDISLDETINYIIEQEKLSSQQKTKIKYEFERCIFLHETYKDKLNCLKFSLRDIRHMSAKEWIKWVDELNILLKDIYPDEEIGNIEHNICKYIYKKGSKKGISCNKINCKNKRHLDID